ncbi:MAG: hypothetical protein N2045_14250 [Fimbriimonadales bacterium]|nr:hypothetical protein [Fimbriimonadales bacterium]
MQQLDAMAVFSRDKDGADEWVNGKTIYVFDNPTGLARKRAELFKSAMIKWLKM